MKPEWLTDQEVRDLEIQQDDGPIFIDKNGLYYFCDEVWVNLFGPYITRNEATFACREYALTI